MDVLCLLPDPDRATFRRALEPRYTLRFASSWVDVESAIRGFPIGVLVVDLCIDGKPGVGKLRQLRLMFPSVATVLWLPFTYDVVCALLECGEMGITTPLVRGHDSDSLIIARAVEQEMSKGVYSWTLDLVLRHLSPGGPARLRWLLREIFERSDQIRTAEQLSRRAGVDTRTVFRWFRRGGLATPHTVLIAARVLVAGRMLQDPGLTVEDVARRLGYSDSRYLAEHSRKLAGFTPGELRLSFDEAVPKLLVAMLDEPNLIAPTPQFAPPEPERGTRHGSRT